jgi:hypothetical protein
MQGLVAEAVAATAAAAVLAAITVLGMHARPQQYGRYLSVRMLFRLSWQALLH